MPNYRTPISELMSKLDSSESGLTSTQVKAKLKKYGKNELTLTGKPWWLKLIAPFLNIFMVILGIAAAISVLTHEYLDGAIIVAIMVVTAVISYIQESSSERIFKALRTIETQMVSVWRNGKLDSVQPRVIVPGDIIELREGEKVPADARILSSSSLRVDESLLTGESKPVAKQPANIDQDTPIYEQSNMLFSGSYIISGECKALVVATGLQAEFGRLAALADQGMEVSPVQKKIDRLIGQITIAVSLASVIIFGLSLYRGLELGEAIRFVLALAVSAIPESLPVSIAVILVIAARQLAKQKALVRNLSAIENIGIITTIATDKTGTLTQNILKVHHSVPTSGTQHEEFNTLVQLSINRTQANKRTHDPLDTAFHQFSQKADINKYQHQIAYPFNLKLALSGNSWKDKDGTYVTILKGSPEAIVALCGLDKAEANKIEEQINQYTTQGLRVLALAYREDKAKPSVNLNDVAKQQFTFAGILAVGDQLRPETAAAIDTTLSAGVTVRMITGDHFETAYAIGKQLGLAKTKDEVFDCRQMDQLSERELAKVVSKAKVFSRVLPEYKYKILDILKQSHITAMTGDGVNDVPALSNAHIGIAMGSGSQIAKEAGDLVLLDDNFANVVSALRQGRVVFDNIQRMVFYLLSTNAGEVITMIGALILGLPVPLVPVQILWINIVTDTTMEIPLGLQPAEDEVLRRPPRQPDKPILGRVMIGRIIVISTTMAALSLAIFFFIWQDNSTEYARTVTFNALVVMQLANAINARQEWQTSLSGKSLLTNKLFYFALALSIIIQSVMIFTPLGAFLHFVPVNIWHLIIPSILSVIMIIMVGEVHKFIGRQWWGK